MKHSVFPKSKSPVLEKKGTRTRPVLITAQQEAFELPAEGSLGLLALGYVGLMAWREVKRNKSNSGS